jgi:hypothetical protein
MTRPIVLVTFSLPCLLLAAVAFAARQAPLDPADGVYKAGEWQYQLVILNQELADKRAVGKLTYRGKEVIGIAFARITTDVGDFQWAGYGCESERMGWYRIDPQKKYARWVRVRIDESKVGPVWTVRKE